MKGSPSASGRVVAASTMKSSSSVVMRRGRPPAHRGSSDAIPSSLNRWITSRTRSLEVAASLAITGTVLPPADASTTGAPPPANHRPLRLAAAPANNPLELTAFLVRQTTNPQWFRHNPIKARTQPQMVDAPQPPTFVDTALAERAYSSWRRALSRSDRSIGRLHGPGWVATMYGKHALVTGQASVPSMTPRGCGGPAIVTL